MVPTLVENSNFVYLYAVRTSFCKTFYFSQFVIDLEGVMTFSGKLIISSEGFDI